MQHPRQDLSELLDYIKQEKRLLIVFPHYVYGPLRGLNFIIENPEPDYATKWLDTPDKWQGLTYKIWEKSGLSVFPMVFQTDNLNQFETPPKSFNTFKMAEKYLLEVLDKNPSLSDDPYYYRLGIL